MRMIQGTVCPFQSSWTSCFITQFTTASTMHEDDAILLLLVTSPSPQSQTNLFSLSLPHVNYPPNHTEQEEKSGDLQTAVWEASNTE